MHFPNGWLAFELGVLRRLKFASVALPLTGEPELSVQLKNWRVRVAANDPMLWSYTKALALIENNTEQLNDDDFNVGSGRACAFDCARQKPRAIVRWNDNADLDH